MEINLAELVGGLIGVSLYFYLWYVFVYKGLIKDGDLDNFTGACALTFVLAQVVILIIVVGIVIFEWLSEFKIIITL